MKRVLFVCVHNSARSRIAEAYLNSLGAGKFRAESAGLEAGRLNPLAAEVMKEEGLDISAPRPQDVAGLLKQGKTYDMIITVCDAASGERCPLFPGNAIRRHWGFPDPSALTGTHEQKLQNARIIRDKIKEKVSDLVNSDY